MVRLWLYSPIRCWSRILPFQGINLMKRLLYLLIKTEIVDCEITFLVEHPLKEKMLTLWPQLNQLQPTFIINHFVLVPYRHSNGGDLATNWWCFWRACFNAIINTEIITKAKFMVRQYNYDPLIWITFNVSRLFLRVNDE